MTETTVPPARRSRRKIFRGKFLFFSVAAHVVVAILATIWVVQTIKTRPKPAPASARPHVPVTPERPKTAATQSGAPAPALSRILSKGPSPVALPEIASLPTASTAPSRMDGVGSTVGGDLKASGPAASGKVPPFGNFDLAAGGALEGTLYDLKQTRGRRPTGMTADGWEAFVRDWVKGSWDVAALRKFYAGPKPLYAPFIYMPIMSADEGPKAFKLEKRVQPRMWVVHYRAQVRPAQSGKFRFVGFGDDILAVRFNGRVVFNEDDPATLADPPVKYDYAGLGNRGPVGGRWFEVKAGKPSEIEILIGECPGGLFHAYLLLEKAGARYDKDPSGLPILPLFRLSAAEPAPLTAAEIERQSASGHADLIGKAPPFSTKEAPWTAGKSGAAQGTP